MSVSRMSVGQNAGCSMVRARKSEDQLQPCGRFVVEHFRKGEKIGHYEFPNGIANEGKNKLLDVMFHGVSAITTWWLGLIGNSGYSALAAGDTYANINQAGNGLPRLLNHLAQRALEEAAAQNSRTITAAHVQRALELLPWLAQLTR